MSEDAGARNRSKLDGRFGWEPDTPPSRLLRPMLANKAITIPNLTPEAIRLFGNLHRFIIVRRFDQVGSHKSVRAIVVKNPVRNHFSTPTNEESVPEAVDAIL